MAPGKHFINGLSNLVVRGLLSVAGQDSSLRVNEFEKVLYRQQDTEKVLLLSGGGSGHEPAHSGYVGEGMLDICVAGDIFASPSATQVLAGLQALPSPKGVLMIVKNYTGDKLNFGLAAEKAKALGVKVNVVFVGDDVSVEGNELVGRRGLAGVVFVYKIAGALARAGASLEEVTAAAQKAADQLFTVGVSLDRCNVPNREAKEGLPYGELEYGMGIHNEPGVHRATVTQLSDTVSNLLQLLNSSIHLSDQKQAAVMINNMGGLSVLELHVIADEVLKQLLIGGLDVRRIFIGTFVSSLDGPGFSVTVLRLSPEIERYLNEDTKITSWPNFTSVTVNKAKSTSLGKSKINTTSLANEIKPIILLPVASTLVHDILDSIVTRVITDEPLITHYDTIAGDGDCGETLLKGVQAAATSIQLILTTKTLELHTIFSTLASSIESSTGGTSGAIYAIFFNALSNSLPNNSLGTESLAPIISIALSSALSQLCTYTTARRGHKTMMDALIPFVEIFGTTLDLGAAVSAADQGAQATRTLKAVLGRASYVGDEAFNVDGGIPDPGALGVVSVLKGIEAVVGKWQV